ncbi:hypothetical protein [Pedobacter sp. GR22-6]|uniref:hypothetical protein n=1 Tax=Pedobacter sp. GR22-6 TaxID=3127957 RepID=UPI00307E1E2C
MSLPLRIHFEQKDYSYTILTKPITRDMLAIRIELDGEEYEFTKAPDKYWRSDPTISGRAELLAAIARNLSLRFRIY